MAIFGVNLTDFGVKTRVLGLFGPILGVKPGVFGVFWTVLGPKRSFWGVLSLVLGVLRALFRPFWGLFLPRDSSGTTRKNFGVNNIVLE